MKMTKLGLLLLLSATPAFAASTEGVPYYYQNRAGPNTYVGNARTQNVVASNSYSYTVPRTNVPVAGGGYIDGNGAIVGATTPNGVTGMTNPAWILSAEYTRKYGNFQFKTGVNSVLEWDDMILNEIGARLEHNFSMRDIDLFAHAEYRIGTMSDGGFSMDYDLLPFDENRPNEGIFTISMGEQSGKTNYMRFGFGAKNIWNIGGWKFSPEIGYEMFRHDLKMSDHIYPNPATYIPLMGQDGSYIFTDGVNYFAVDPGMGVDDDWAQVCASPEDIKVVQIDAQGRPVVMQDGNGNYVLVSIDYDASWGTVPWGVGPGECVVIGGDGVNKVPGTTHIYNTKWQGIYVGLGIEKQMTYTDKLRFYFQAGMPSYYSEGTWPMRTDWQQHPSFIDEGDNGAYSYNAEIEYTMNLSERLNLSLKADMSYFYVGKVGGKLFVAEYLRYVTDEFGNIQYYPPGDPNEGEAIIEVVPAHTEKVSDSLEHAIWQSFGLSIGLKYTF